MQHFLYILMVAGVITACGSQRKLQKTYTGQPAEVLQGAYGEPASIIKTGNDSVYIFEKSEELRSTEISQGRLSLDPIVTPAVVKTQRYYFTVKNGIITSVRTDEEYER